MGKYNKIALCTQAVKKFFKQLISQGQCQRQFIRLHNLGSSSWSWRGLGGRCQDITFCLRSVLRTRPHRRAPVLAGLLEPPSSVLSSEQLPKSRPQVSSSALSLASTTLILSPTTLPPTSLKCQQIHESPQNTVQRIILQRIRESLHQSPETTQHAALYHAIPPRSPVHHPQWFDAMFAFSYIIFFQCPVWPLDLAASPPQTDLCGFPLQTSPRPCLHTTLPLSRQHGSSFVPPPRWSTGLQLSASIKLGKFPLCNQMTDR